MHSTCSQLALSLIISCFHGSPGRAVPMPKSLFPLFSYSNRASRIVLALDTNFVQLSLQITSVSAVLPTLLARESISMYM